MSRIVLASASPQRKTLLHGLGVLFSIAPSDVEEDDHPESDPAKRAADLARLKAKAVAAKSPDSFVIGCDTLVVSPTGALFEKPKDAGEAAAMLRAHSGATSLVHSALCIVDPEGRLYEGIDTSSVRFRTLSEEDIAWWIGTELWRDRSGGFQIDGKGQLLIEHIEGDWTGIVGLPIFLLGKLAKDAKLDLL